MIGALRWITYLNVSYARFLNPYIILIYFSICGSLSDTGLFIAYVIEKF
jgi:hypothetical protein